MKGMKVAITAVVQSVEVTFARAGGISVTHSRANTPMGVTFTPFIETATGERIIILTYGNTVPVYTDGAVLYAGRERTGRNTNQGG